MKAAEISEVLTKNGIEHFFDSCNPDFTIHLTQTAALIDTCDCDIDKQGWQLLDIKRNCINIPNIDALMPAVNAHLKEWNDASN